jgi:hypothetical protein
MKTQLKYLFPHLLLILLMAGLAACVPAGQSSDGGLQAPQPASDETQLVSPSAVVDSELEPPAEQPEESLPVFACTETNPHPMGQSIVETYDDATYEQVMTWFCNGYTFDDILIALETSEATEVPAPVLLEMLWEKSWEEIWQEIDFLQE